MSNQNAAGLTKADNRTSVTNMVRNWKARCTKNVPFFTKIQQFCDSEMAQRLDEKDVATCAFRTLDLVFDHLELGSSEKLA